MEKPIKDESGGFFVRYLVYPFFRCLRFYKNRSFYPLSCFSIESVVFTKRKQPSDAWKEIDGVCW